jgi:hypothetical protein
VRIFNFQFSIFKQLRIKIIVFAAIIVGAGIGAMIFYNKAPKTARITAEVPSGISVSQSIDLPIFIDTRDYTINAAEVYLTYDPQLVTVESVSKDNSFFQLWITDEPKFSNEKGQLSFAGGLPTPGFKGRGQIGTVTLKLLKPGHTNLTFDPKTRVLLNDGQGTAVPLYVAPISLLVQ